MQSLTHRAHALATGRQDTQHGEGAPVHDDLAIDEDLVLAVAPGLVIDLDLQLPPDLRRHPDGVDAGDSERAIANNDSGHVFLLDR